MSGSKGKGVSKESLERMPHYFFANMQPSSSKGVRFGHGVLDVDTEEDGRLPGEIKSSVVCYGYQLRMGVTDNGRFWVGVYNPDKKISLDSEIARSLLHLNSNLVTHTNKKSYSSYFSNGKISDKSSSDFLIAEYESRSDDSDTIFLGIFSGLKGIMKILYDESRFRSGIKLR